ncbi:MAG: hypothetical protein ACK5LC_17405 [Coprobacillaceae bacterium]
MFYILEGLGYFLFLWLDSKYLFSISSVIKYACVIGCLLFLLYRFIEKREFRVQISMLALAVIADYFLLFTNQHKIGVFIFCLLQCCYTKILYNQIDYISLLFPYIFISFFVDVMFLSGIYAVHSVINLVTAWVMHVKTKDRKNMYLFIAILLLLLCDIHVVLQHMQWFPEYQQVIGFMIWLFYLPSLWCLLRSYTLSSKVMV